MVPLQPVVVATSQENDPAFRAYYENQYGRRFLNEWPVLELVPSGFGGSISPTC